MIKITVGDLLKNCKAKLLIGSEKTEINECFINSKDVTYGGCFFGIKGKKVNGSLFYKQAFSNGANVCVLNKIYDLDLKGYDDKTVIIADDPLEVLQSLALYKRSLFNGTVIAITGSVGKTTTKEMVANVLSKKYKVLKTISNQNSQIGLPLTILRLKDEDVMVLELGMNHKGELHNLSLIAKPDISIITNVYESHIGNLGSLENILKAKLEIIDGMDNGILIINNDNDMLKKINPNLKNHINLTTYGISCLSDYMATDIIDDKITSFRINDVENLYVNGGKTFIYNALPAFIIGKLLKVDEKDIKDAIASSVMLDHRLNSVSLKNNITLIDDTYNASFESVKVALQYVSKFDNKRKIAVLADILELGKQTKKIHQKIADELVKNNIDFVITIGKYSKIIKHKLKHLRIKKANLKHFKNEQKARKYVKELLKEDDVILIKGSNKTGLINLVEYLKEELGS